MTFQALVGERLERALEQLEQRGISDVCVTETRAPRGREPRGHLRALRISDDGRAVLCARFPDEVDSIEA